MVHCNRSGGLIPAHVKTAFHDGRLSNE